MKSFKEYNKLAHADTLIDKNIFSYKKSPIGGDIAFYISITICSAFLTFFYNIMSRASIPKDCIESIHSLKFGNSLTCEDPRTHIDIVNNNNNIAFACKCNGNK